MPSTISAGTTAGTAIAIAGDTTGNLAFQTNGTTTAMTITTSQNVGIGTTSPTAPLTVVTPSGGLALQINGRSSDNLGGLYFYANNGTTSYSQITASASEYRVASQSTAVQTFYTNGSERMRIDSSGNVGVGATSLAATFTVNSVSQGNGNQGVINRIRNNHYVGYASREISTNTNIFQVGPFPANDVGGGGAIVRIVVGGVKGGIDFHGSVYEYMVVKSGQNALTINTVHNFGITGVTSTVSGNYAIFGLNFTNYSGASMTFEVLCGAAANPSTEYILTPTFV